MEYKILREKMIEEQIIPRGIKNRAVISALTKVPRHLFVPDEYINSAYTDHPLPIGRGQTISQPYMVALMTEELKPKKNETILEIGTGSGYQAAILAELFKKVFSMERVPELAKKSSETLKTLNYSNVVMITGDGSLGSNENAPYDKILVTCGAPGIPSSYVDQLKDGGIIVIPLGNRFGQTLSVITKKNGQLQAKEICGCVFVPLVGKDGWKV